MTSRTGGTDDLIYVSPRTGRAVRPREEAAHVAFAAPDISQIADPPQSYGGSVPRAKALAGEVLLAWAMNGQPLPSVHGGPVRVVVPGYIGARSVKWVERVTLQDHPSGNYFQATAYRLLPPGAAPAAAGPAANVPATPEQAFQAVCSACH